MRVLHVIPSISAKAGGPSQAIIPMCRALREQGIDLVLATADDGTSPGNGNSPGYGHIREHEGQPTVFFPSQIGASFKYSRPFATWLDDNVAKFDLVHIHAIFNHACIAAARACRRHDVPYIIRPLGTLDPWSMKQKSWRKKIFWHGGIHQMLRAAAAVHYTSIGEQEATEQSLGLNHGVVVPLGIEPAECGAPDSFEHVAEGVWSKARPYVLVLSRLLPTKGLDVLLEAFLAFRSEQGNERWNLVFAGEGPKEFVTRLKRTAADADASEHVLFPGWLKDESKSAVLHHASLLALPSHHENFGLCVMEALASGVPVLVSPHVNLATEVQAAGAGWVASVDKKSIETALAHALSSEDERVRRGEAGRLLSNRYAWPVVAGMLNSMYGDVLAANVLFPSPVERGVGERD